MKKKMIIIISTVLGLLLLGGGITYAVMKTTGKEVRVIPVGEINTGYWGGNVDISGIVTSNASQEVHLTDKEIVQEVYVKEGDTVQMGTSLMSFDMTMTNLNLESEKLTKESLGIKKNALEKEIGRLKKKTPVKKTADAGNAGGMQFMTAETKGARLVPLSAEGGEGTETPPETPGNPEDPENPNNPNDPEPIMYKIIFQNWDKSVISTKEYEAGTDIVIPEDPSRVEDDDYTYTFSGWTPEVESTAEKDATYTAKYEPVLKEGTYRIVFLDWDDAILSEETYEEGQTIILPKDPVRAPEDKYTYSFSGWDPKVVSTAMGDATYKAQYEQKPVETIVPTPTEELTLENYMEAWYKGDGSQENPYYFLGKWDGKDYHVSMRGDFLNAARENGTCFWIQLFENNDITDMLRAAIYIDGSKLGEYDDERPYRANIQPVDDGEEPLPDPSLPDPGYDGQEDFNGGDVLSPDEVVEGYTKEELDKLISEKRKELKTLDLDIRQSDLKIAQVQKSLDNQEVKSTVTGIVKSVGDPEKGQADGKPFLVVESTEGLYVQGSLSEMMLSDIKEGQVLQGTSYESGIPFEAEIREISTYPTDSQGGYWGGNSNASYYPFTAYIAEGMGLRNNENVGFTATVGNQSAEEDLYVQKAFVREEDGKHYVYVAGENQRLERREIEAGRTVDGYSIEIKSGLTNEDMIAFPYGKDVKPGAKTKEATMGDLYM